MAKRLVISEFWERTKLGKLAPHSSNAESHLHLVKRPEKFNKQDEFIKWVTMYGDHSKGYLLRTVKVDVDEKYDPNSGMVSIKISQPEYSARIHRKGEGWETTTTENITIFRILIGMNMSQLAIQFELLR